MRLNDTVDSIKGIGEKTKEHFEKLGVSSVGELLTFYPRRYESFKTPSVVRRIRLHSEQKEWLRGEIKPTFPEKSLK